MTSNKEVSTRNTKAEIVEAYEELLIEVQKKTSDKPQEIKEWEEKKQTIAHTYENTEESIVKDIGSLKLEISNSLDKVSESLQSEFNRLKGIQKAISIEKNNLEDLYLLQ